PRGVVAPPRRTTLRTRLEGIHMRRDEPNRHGRAADALIASYLRELLADDERESMPDTTRLEAAATPLALTAPAQGTAATDAVL
ncbi:MAG TPA: hypothetical protein VFS37_08055, partial [Conexibacter sp.]|nr:hypothetical protein [Conexibacter sp.]